MKLLLSKLILFSVCIYSVSATFRSCATKKINNGRFWPAKTTINSGLSIKFQCDAGYHLSGSRYSTCWNGRWNRAFPSCSKSNDDQSCKWTAYYNRNSPAGTGDYETLHDLRKERPGQICAHPVKFEARTASGHIPYQKTGEKVSASRTHGLICLNNHQRDRRCHDYEIRFCCPSAPQPPTDACKWTAYYNRDSPANTGDYETLHDLRKERPGQICAHPVKFEARTASGHIPYQKTGEKVSASRTQGLICLNNHQRDRRCHDYEIRFCCPSAPQPPTDACKWTAYYNRDSPANTGDYETLHDLRKERPGQICAHPVKFEARTASGHIPYQKTGEKVSASRTQGLICLNNHQRDRRCHDYEIRFCCPSAPQPPTDACKWTAYYNRNSPAGTGDYETLHDLRKERPGQICAHPVKFEARTASGHIPYQKTGEKVSASRTQGLICLNNHQRDRRCHDYEIRFCCPSAPQPPTDACKWTRYFNRDNQHYTGDHESLSKLRRDYPGQICSKPVKFEARTVQGHIPYHKTGEKLTVSLTHGLTCLNKDQRDRQCKNYEIRFCCPASQSGCRPYRVWNSYVRDYRHLYAHGQSITYNCKDGYKLEGSATLKCNDGKWDHGAPKCVRKQDDPKRCKGPGDFNAGRYHPIKDYYYPGETVWFKCDDSYTLVGTKDVRCQKGGVWTADFPHCKKDEEESCRQINQPDNGDFTPRQDVYLVDDTVRFTCDKGFDLVGSDFIECLDGGKWTDEEPICRKRECRAPEEYPYGTYEPILDEYKEGDSLWFHCNAGFELQGKKDIFCEADGSWSHPFPVCERLPTCGPPEGPGNGKFEPVQDIYVLGDAIAYSCSPGYTLVGDEALLCLEDGWSFDEPICEKDEVKGCPKPGVPKNGRVHPDLGNKLYNIGQKAWYKCSLGYAISGVKDIKCRDDGTWSAPPATCTPSCKGRCGSYNIDKFPCQCLAVCHKKKNCCADIKDVCH